MIDDDNRADVHPIAVPEGRRTAQRLLSHARTVLAAQIFKEHVPVGHHNPCVTTGDAGYIEVRNAESLEQLFVRLAVTFGCGGTTCYETQAAKDVEHIVSDELKAHSAAARGD